MQCDVEPHGCMVAENLKISPARRKSALPSILAAEDLAQGLGQGGRQVSGAMLCRTVYLFHLRHANLGKEVFEPLIRDPIQNLTYEVLPIAPEFSVSVEIGKELANSVEFKDVTCARQTEGIPPLDRRPLIESTASRRSLCHP